MVISEFVRETAKQLGDNARFEAELMVMSVMEMDRTRLVLNGKLPVMPQHTYRMNKMIERRKKGPAQTGPDRQSAPLWGVPSCPPPRPGSAPCQRPAHTGRTG